MAWAPAVGLLLGVIAAAVLLAADHPLGAGPADRGRARGRRPRPAQPGAAPRRPGRPGRRPGQRQARPCRAGHHAPLGHRADRHRHAYLRLLIQVAAVSQAEAAGDGRGPAALIAAVVTGRLAITWACRRGVPAARPDGLGALVAGTVRAAIPVAATLATLAVTGAAVAISATVIGEPLGWTLPLAVAAGLAAAFGLQRHAVRRLGGITGDVLGALAEVAATVTLVVAAMGPRA